MEIERAIHSPRRRQEALSSLGRFILRWNEELKGADELVQTTGYIELRELKAFFEERARPLAGASGNGAREYRFDGVQDALTSPSSRKQAADVIHITGTVHTFGEIFDLGDGLTETVSQSAFDQTLQDHDHITMNIEHNNNLAIAATGGALRLTATPRTLRMSADVKRNSVTEFIADNIEGGVFGGMSFAFVCVQDDFRLMAHQQVQRTIESVQLFDVSLVCHPAYANTGAHIVDDGRSVIPLAENLESKRLKRWVSTLRN